MGIAILIRGVRDRLIGLSAVSARFDILQQKLDGLTNSAEDAEATLRSLHEQLEHLPRRDELSVIENQGKLIKSLSRRLDLLEDQARKMRMGEAWEEDAVQIRDEGGSAHATPFEEKAGTLINRVGFLVQSLELINHFSSVWEKLPPGSFDVLVHGEASEAPSSTFVRWTNRVLPTSQLLSGSRRYRYLVSNHPVSDGDPPLIKRLAQHNIRFMYAAGKSGWNLSAWNRLYDAILCFGPYHADSFAKVTDAVILQMGYPRFDRYFNTQPDRQALNGQFGCDPARKTVVWLPTWQSLSSVGLFDEEISALTDRFNVVVKLHPLMRESEPERVAALRRFHFTHLITDSRDNQPLYQLADYMLFDYGGPPLAGIYCDKNIVLLNVPGADANELTGDTSPDITIRNALVSLNPGENRLLTILLDDSHWQKQVVPRRELRKQYFAPHFGFAANVAAGALLNLDKIIGIRP